MGVHSSDDPRVMGPEEPSAHRGKNVIRPAACGKPEAAWHPEAITNTPTTSRLSFLLGVEATVVATAECNFFLIKDGEKTWLGGRPHISEALKGANKRQTC